MAGKDASREMRAEELHRMYVDGETRLPVAGEHALPLRGLGKLRCLRGRIEWQGELALLAA
jgi:hypothetical protein